PSIGGSTCSTRCPRSRQSAVISESAVRLSATTGAPFGVLLVKAMRSVSGAAPTSERNGRAGGAAAEGSPGPWPAVASSNAAQSRTESGAGGWVERPRRPSPAYGAIVLRDRVGLSPTTPQHDAGARIEPKPSDACAIGTIRAPTAAAAPPLEPPEMRD